MAVVEPVVARVGQPTRDASGMADRLPGQLAGARQPTSIEAEEEALATAIDRGQPFGEPTWVTRIAERRGLESTLRPRGRPSKPEK